MCSNACRAGGFWLPLVLAFQMVASLGACRYRTAWRLGQVGLPDDDPYKKVYDISPDRAKAKVNKSGNLLFHGESARNGAPCALRELCWGGVTGPWASIATASSARIQLP